MTSEQTKMLSGKLYNPNDPALHNLRHHARKLTYAYNQLAITDPKRETLLKELIPHIGLGCDIQGPIAADYGCFTTLGDNVFINYNLTLLDCAPIFIGDNTMLGPNVSLLTPVHPLRFQERNIRQDNQGNSYNYEYAKSIVIEENCWLAGNVTVIGGVTIGAGSVVTRDIPANSIAVGNPCRVIREITEADKMTLPE